MTTVTQILAAGHRHTCGCGEDQIPGFLARVGVFGTAFLVLGGLTAMILAGLLLGGLVWVVTRWWRRGEGAVTEVEVWQTPPGDEAERSFFGRFGRWEEDRPG
jgi:hypothetical protein